MAEQREDAKENALYFSDRGIVIDDSMLARLVWAPILPVSGTTADA